MCQPFSWVLHTFKQLRVSLLVDTSVCVMLPAIFDGDTVFSLLVT